MKENSSIMLEKGTWPYSSSNSFTRSSNNGHIERPPGSANEGNRSSNCLDACMASIGDEMFDGDPVLIDHTAKVDSDSYHYSLTQPVDDLSFMDSEQVEKGNGDLMFYNWPEIESFEDIDKMFRSCDSTFGFGVNNADDLGWLSSANGPEGSDDPLKPSFEMPGANFTTLETANGHDGDVCPLPDGTNKELASISETSSSNRLDANGSAVAIFSSYDGEGRPIFIDDTQTISLDAQLKAQNPSDLEKEDNYHEQGQPLVHLNNMNQPDGPNLVLTSPSLVKCEDNGQSISRKESSDASNQMQTVKSINGFVEGKKKGFLEHNGFPETNHDKSAMISDPDIAHNQVSSFESGIEGQSEFNANGVTSFPAEFDPSNLPESSCSSALDDVSLEASSFRQLQNVMEKLDIKTKLCIRDSLYRLARSAEQKHKCPDRRGGIRFDQDGNEALVPDETDKCNELMDMEADTNPIDRSIAHLLFHRPSYSTKPLTKAHKSNNAPAAVVVETPVSQEESSGAVAK